MLSELLQLIILKGNVSMKKILIVDDDKRVVRMLEEYMKLYNFQTLCAGNGKDALALYDERKENEIFLKCIQFHQ